VDADKVAGKGSEGRRSRSFDVVKIADEVDMALCPDCD
jgi:hypothetical protein